MTEHVCLVEGQHQGQPRLVEDGAGVEHVGHEGGGRGGARGVDDVDERGGEGGGEQLRDDGPGGGPREDLDLACGSGGWVSVGVGDV